jgi:hypothetical protein
VANLERDNYRHWVIDQLLSRAIESEGRWNELIHLELAEMVENGNDDIHQLNEMMIGWGLIGLSHPEFCRVHGVKPTRAAHVPRMKHE